MFTKSIVFLLQKKAKVYLKIADIDIGGTRRTAFHLRQILVPVRISRSFLIETHILVATFSVHFFEALGSL